MAAAAASVYYEYEALPQNPATCIRVLRILSKPGEPVECTLEIIDLDQNPQYDCLSYTWSDPLYRGLPLDDGEGHDVPEIKADRDKTIHCDGRAIKVTENLVDALGELGRRGYATSQQGLDGGGGGDANGDRTYLWIDAVCINQENVKEQSQQVNLMGRIYKQAKRVVIWLGKEDRYTPDGIYVLNRLSSAKPRTNDMVVQELDRREVCDSLGIEYIDTEQWTAYIVFLQRTWFSRIWVVQESYFAAEKEVLCGSYTISWDKIIRCARLLESTNLGDLLKMALLGLLDHNYGFIGSEKGDQFDSHLNNQLIFAVLSRTSTQQSLNLTQLLYYSKFFDATKAFDHVYAIRDIWETAKQNVQGRERGEHGETATYRIVPDCERPVQDVFCEATYFAVQEADNLNILALVDGRAIGKESGWPSWVPDYSAGSKIRPLAEANLFGVATSTSDNSKRWNAGKGLQRQKPPSLNWSTKLPVNGLLVDRVEEKGPTYLSVDRFHIRALLKFLAEYPESRPSYPGSESSSVCDAFWKTIIKDTFRGRPADEEARIAFPPFIMEYIRELRVEMDKREDPDDIAKLSTLLHDAEGFLKSLAVKYASERVIPTIEQVDAMIQIEDLEGSPEEREQVRNRTDMSESFKAAYFGRRVFRTQGGYFGIAAEPLVPGDSVWILAGASTPFVLRHVREDDWQVVGEAYVFGLMNGLPSQTEGVSTGESTRQIQLV